MPTIDPKGKVADFGRTIALLTTLTAGGAIGCNPQADSAQVTNSNNTGDNQGLNTLLHADIQEKAPVSPNLKSSKNENIQLLKLQMSIEETSKKPDSLEKMQDLQKDYEEIYKLFKTSSSDSFKRQARTKMSKVLNSTNLASFKVRKLNNMKLTQQSTKILSSMTTKLQEANNYLD